MYVRITQIDIKKKWINKFFNHEMKKIKKKSLHEPQEI